MKNKCSRSVKHLDADHEEVDEVVWHAHAAENPPQRSIFPLYVLFFMKYEGESAQNSSKVDMKQVNQEANVNHGGLL